ncbi:3-deoxy-D-manno-octulosonic acid transferase [Bombella sp. ESL0378]|uniref:3-deoxy-D-manno-octulosonic acid transferase n=1 Tax=unclassified Bombella TaxID=2644098 RepID=UPI0012D92853|nr:MULTISPECIES: glycosyltransferase N-terminal domain-containing protein [unclassified Bombella]MUG04750.1 3-deoxy-D-manno-octulosonic acid transferase [Bombella sp. ESL0378]MUG90292.1 3-deoxy-D-manno-octulosonic acid transferase [Bombella sp. ESL0385]
MRFAPLLCLWSLIGYMAMPWLCRHTRTRLRIGKEDGSRLQERFGQPTQPRPPLNAPLLWLHAASVGESRAALPVIDALLKLQPTLTILVTTATLTGGQVITAHAPPYKGRLLHQFIPYDAPHLLSRFLTHWRPDGLVLIESELWPGLLCLCRRQHIPVMLLNGRLSARSARRWRLAAPLLRYLLRPCRWIMPRSHADERAFAQLGITSLLPPADLKEDAPPLSFDSTEAAHIRQQLGDRPLFVAASTHQGEEDLIVAAVQEARQQRPNLLTVIIPRHPERGAALATHFKAPRRSQNTIPHHNESLWIIDTLGEVGLFLHLAERVFIGHSLCPPGGGHNPLESLRFHRPTACGPYMQNWQDICATYATFLHRLEGQEALTQWLIKPVIPAPPPLKRTHISHDISCLILTTILSHKEK